MPIIKSAKKALKQTRKRTAANKSQKRVLKDKIVAYQKHQDLKGLRAIFSLADKLAKTGAIHPNKAAHLKSRLSHLLKEKSSPAKPAAKA